MAVVWCRHERTVTDGGESVCVACGVVTGTERWAGTEGMAGESRANLYEAVEVGSREAAPAMSFAMERGSGDIRRYFRGRMVPGRELSDFSNMCEKVSLPMAVQEYAWVLYRRAARAGAGRGTAERACWAVRTACRTHGVPRSDTEVMAAAMAAYGRRRLPEMFTILYRHMEVPGGDGGGSETYHFNLCMRRMVCGVEMTEAEFAARKAEAWEMFTSTFTEGDAGCRARRAISAAFGL